LENDLNTARFVVAIVAQRVQKCAVWQLKLRLDAVWGDRRARRSYAHTKGGRRINLCCGGTVRRSSRSGDIV
jgi:hypothetical protein